MMKVRALPSAEVVAGAFHFRPFSAGAFSAMADQVAVVDGKSLVPEREPDGDDLDDVTHKRKDGTK